MTTRLQHEQRLRELGMELDRNLNNLESLRDKGYMGSYEQLYMTKCNMLDGALMSQTQIVEVLLKMQNLSAEPLWFNRIQRIKHIIKTGSW